MDVVYIEKGLEDIIGLLGTIAPAGAANHTPIYKILFSLEHKGFLHSIVIDKEAQCEQFNAERQFIKQTPECVTRLHFFGERVSETEIPYGGYCDLRPDGTVVDAFITTQTVRKKKSDSYAFIPSAIEFPCTFPTPEDPKKNSNASIYGFHYIQKNNHETMCAQAAMLGVIRYWQFKTQGNLFGGIKSTIDINRYAGVDLALLAAGNKHGGLTYDEMTTFLKGQNVGFLCRNFSGFTRNKISNENIVKNIYGFIESGYPVLLTIKTDKEPHVITIIGHTFDKNSWQAMADVGYFNGNSAVGDYHSNVAWIENLIVLDDNLGPYYFLKTSIIDEIAYAMFVSLPCGDVILPHMVTQMAASRTILTKEFYGAVLCVLEEEPQPGAACLTEENKKWLRTFLPHIDPKTEKRPVLRPLLRRRDQVYDDYKEHEFLPILHKILDPLEGCDFFWMVELSWPDAYCYRQSTCGMILVSATNYDMPWLIVHLPGLLVLCEPNLDWEKNLHYAKTEDAPRPHIMPGLNCCI